LITSPRDAKGSDNPPMHERSDGLADDDVIHQRNIQHVQCALHATRIFNVIRRGLMIPERIASNAEHLFRVPRQRLAKNFSRKDLNSIVLAAADAPFEQVVGAVEDCGDVGEDEIGGAVTRFNACEKRRQVSAIGRSQQGTSVRAAIRFRYVRRLEALGAPVAEATNVTEVAVAVFAQSANAPAVAFATGDRKEIFWGTSCDATSSHWLTLTQSKSNNRHALSIESRAL
jgi:hypothetical protein